MIWKLVTDCLFFLHEFGENLINTILQYTTMWTGPLNYWHVLPPPRLIKKLSKQWIIALSQCSMRWLVSKIELKSKWCSQWTLVSTCYFTDGLLDCTLSVHVKTFFWLWWMFRLHSLSQCKLKHVILYCDGRLDSRLHSLSANSNMFMLYCDGCLDCSFKHVMLYCDGLLDCTISVQV